MEILSINVGKSKKVKWQNKEILTSIFKNPIGEESVKVNFNNIEGDEQSDLVNHGGTDKAVYAYASEHYEYWDKQFPDLEKPWGIFGENLTVRGGLFEEQINIGDCFQLGSVELMAVQPRYPCFKLEIRFGFKEIFEEFLKNSRSGIYFKILKEGIIQKGDKLIKIKSAEDSLSILEIYSLLNGKNKDIDLMKKAILLEHLADSVKNKLKKRLTN